MSDKNVTQSSFLLVRYIFYTIYKTTYRERHSINFRLKGEYALVYSQRHESWTLYTPKFLSWKVGKLFCRWNCTRVATYLNSLHFKFHSKIQKKQSSCTNLFLHIFAFLFSWQKKWHIVNFGHAVLVQLAACVNQIVFVLPSHVCWHQQEAEGGCWRCILWEYFWKNSLLSWVG